MYRDCEGLDEIKRVINFPKLEMPPADFLQNMEDYAKQAPRQFDDSGPKKVSAATAHVHKPVQVNLVSINRCPSHLFIIAVILLRRRARH